MSALFPAQWSGKCKSCGARFDEGDDIGYNDDQLVCIECWEDDYVDWKSMGLPS